MFASKHLSFGLDMCRYCCGICGICVDMCRLFCLDVSVIAVVYVVDLCALHLGIDALHLTSTICAPT